jgi:hypothetical protein
MILHTGDLVRIKESGLLALVMNVDGKQFSLKHRTTAKQAWYNQDEVELVERGHYAKLFSPEEIKTFEEKWGGMVTFFGNEVTKCTKSE